MAEQKPWEAALTLLLVIVPAYLIWNASCWSSDSKHADSKLASEKPQNQIGYEGHLENAPVADSEDDLKAAAKYVSAKDRVGINELIAEGKLWYADDGTKVKLLDISVQWLAGDNFDDIRIESGPRKGEEGWTVSKCLK